MIAHRVIFLSYHKYSCQIIKIHPTATLSNYCKQTTNVKLCSSDIFAQVIYADRKI